MTVHITMGQFISEHYQYKDGLRLGQRFINRFISKEWPELFYEEDDQKAIFLIEKWLQENHYINELPQPARRY